MTPRRRTSDALRALDQLLDTHVQGADAGPLTNLALTLAMENSGAARAILLHDDGRGLAPRIGFAQGAISLAPEEIVCDAELVSRVARSLTLETSPGRVAAPVQVRGQLLGVVILEAGAEPFHPDVETLARSSASTIARLLHSARLIGDAAHRARNVETLEAIGRVLSASALGDHHLGQALEAAQRSTASTDAMLALLNPGGDVLDLHLRGDPLTLRPLAHSLASSLAQRKLEEAERSLGEPGLLEPLVSEVLQAHRGALQRPPLGFLAVRRPGGAPYDEAERTVLRALAHLLAAAIARLDYYKKAAEDALTGTGSRLALELAIVEKLERARRAGSVLSALLIDVDRFKQINDGHGHLVGDAVLKGVAEALQSRLREADFVARFGGDEFLVLLPDTQVHEALAVAEGLRALIASREFAEERVKVTLSIGVASFPGHASKPRELLRAADEALYKSKAAGRNAVTLAHG